MKKALFILLIIVCCYHVGSALEFKDINQASANRDSIDGEVYLLEQMVDDHIAAPTGIHACDFEDDGDNDVFCSSVGDGIVWWRNEGGHPVQWIRQTVDETFLGAMYVYVADVDGDEDKDVLGVSWDRNEISWWRNDGGDPIIWVKDEISVNFAGAHEVYADDVNGDGHMDVLGSAADDHEIAVWFNNGNNPVGWSKQVLDDAFDGSRSVGTADIDGDGNLDVIGAALLDHDVCWWRNDGSDPIQWEKHAIDGNFAGAHRVQACDMDLDGDPDILGAGWNSSAIAWWRNDGEVDNWVKQTIDGQFTGAVIAHAADLDGDSDMDVLGTAQGSNVVAWYRNLGENTFEWEKTVIDDNFGGVWPGYACDLNGDSRIDIVAGGNTAHDIKWWENSEVYLIPDFTAEPTTGHAPFDVEFVDVSQSNLEIDSWEWDFDNDGTIDSYDANPTWTYTQPGIYSVFLKVTIENSSKVIVQQDLINVFDGESAIHFNGRNTHIQIDASSELNLTENFTIETWIKPTTWGESNDVGLGRIMDKTKIALYLIGTTPVYNDSSLVFQLSHDDGTVSRTNTPINSMELNQWQHIAATYDNENNVTIFINGIEQELTQSPAPSGIIADNGNYDMFIGNSSNHAWTFDGIIDEFRIWDDVRSQSEIEENKDYSLEGHEDGLLSYWKMNEGSGDVILDNATGHHGILSNGLWTWGKELYQSAIEETYVSNPIRFALHQNYPNPFNPRTIIDFELPKTSIINLKIYDVHGKLVKNLLDSTMDAGYHSVLWNGKNEDGESAPSGIYLYQIITEKINQTKQMILLK